VEDPYSVLNYHSAVFDRKVTLNALKRKDTARVFPEKEEKFKDD
jgi:hypothetical protein